MRWLLVPISALALGACASLAGLDAADSLEGEGEGASDPAATSTTSSSGSQSDPVQSSADAGASSTSSGGEATTDAGTDAGPPPPPPDPECDEDDDCPGTGNARVCNQLGRCVKQCKARGEECSLTSLDQCCIGLVCAIVDGSLRPRCTGL